MRKYALRLSASATTASNLGMSRTSVLCQERPRVSRTKNKKITYTDINEAKQCYHCQGLGHVQADCPTLRISGAGPQGGRCYSCSQVGHLARDCPTPNANPGARPAAAPSAPRGRGGFRGGYYGVQNNRAANCYKCGGPNHYARDCQAQAIKCYACGKLVCCLCSRKESLI